MENKPFIFSGIQIKPGERKVVLFPAPNIITQTKIDTPVHIFHGKKIGPKLFIVSAIHGDELNSIEIIRRIHERIRMHHLAGTLITVPVVNIHGVTMRKRYLLDRRDLNRSFPGRKTGTLAARLAYGIMQQIVSCCDYGIDLHTGAVGRVNMPQLRVDFSTPKSKRFALSFSAPIILNSKQRDGSLREAASKLGIPLIVYEGGEALRFNEFCIRAGVRGIMNVMHHLRMLPAEDDLITQKSKSVITATSRWVRAPANGLIEPMGDILTKAVKKGEVLARVHDPFLIHPSIDVVAPFKGIVIGQILQAMATEGDALYHVASFEKIAGVRAYIDEYREEIIQQE